MAPRVQDDTSGSPSTPTVTGGSSPRRVTPPDRREGMRTGGHLITLVGYLGMITGPFLPWATSMLFWMTGIEYSDYRAMVYVMLGAFGLLVAVASLARRQDVFLWAPFVIGTIGLGLSIYYLVDLESRLPHLVQELFNAWPGVGIFFCTIGSAIVLIGATVTLVARR